MKKSKHSKQLRQKAISQIIAKYGTTSPSAIKKYLLSDHNIDTSLKTITYDLKENLNKVSFEDFDKIKNTMLSEIETLIQLAYTIATSGGKDALKAMGQYDKLFKTKADVVKKFEEMKRAFTEIDKPIFNITLGELKETKKKGHKKNGR